MLIEIENLTYGHPNKEPGMLPALRGISLRIAEGEYVAVIGANGSGKTTLARHFNALLQPTSGSVRISGLDTKNPRNHAAIRAMVGMVFQSPEDQIIATTVEEDVAFGPENLGIVPQEIRERVNAALQVTGMADFRLRPPHQLSAGQVQRLALAGILAMRPRCIIFDEPTAMLDPVGRKDVQALLSQLHKEGITILYITHYMEEAVLAERVVILDHGQVAADGTPAQVFNNTDSLNKAGLDRPPAARLADLLRPYIPQFAEGIYTVEEMTRALQECPVPSGKIIEQTALETELQSSLITVHDLGYTYLKGTPFAERALTGANLKVDEHFSHGLIGATGSGKSTLLQHLNGLIRPQEGTVRVGPYDLNDPKVALKTVCQLVGMAFQIPETQFFEQYVGDEIAFGPRQMGIRTENLVEQVKQAMAMVGLDFDGYKDRLLFTLSGGEKRKVALASVLALHPRILALDEPLAGLDPLSRRDLLQNLRQWQADGTTMVVSSHYMEDLVELVGAVTVLKNGNDVISGSLAEVFSQVERLEEAGLEPPLVPRVADSMQKMGWALPTGLVHQDDLVRAVSALEKAGAHG
jgi:energy-coupling factor transport system ATP-binding protein